MPASLGASRATPRGARLPPRTGRPQAAALQAQRGWRSPLKHALRKVSCAAVCPWKSPMPADEIARHRAMRGPFGQDGTGLAPAPPLGRRAARSGWSLEITGGRVRRVASVRTAPSSVIGRSRRHRLCSHRPVEGALTESAGRADARAAAGATDEVVTARISPRTERASCCVKNERPCRFLGPVGSTARNSIRSTQVSLAGPSQKPIDGRKVATLGSLAARAQAGRTAPIRARSLLIFVVASGAVPSEAASQPATSSARLSLSGPEAPEGSIEQLCGARSILRSTSDALIDEGRCRRIASPSCPRAKRGARAR